MIGAPLAPMAVIAGAGSGKSETMAARLVWLVANRPGPARAGARPHLHQEGRRRAGRPGRGPGWTGCTAPGLAGSGDDELPGEPTVSTYHAYAGRLVADHALRDGLEPSLRLVTPGRRPGRSPRAWWPPTTGRWTPSNWAPATVTAAVLDLAGELAEHLRTAEDVLAAGGWLRRSAWPACPAGCPR